jgi:hypothetical protein
MGIQVDRMAGGHGGVGNFADLAKTVQSVEPVLERV